MNNGQRRWRATASLLRATATAAVMFLGLLTSEAIFSSDGLARTEIVYSAKAALLIAVFLFPYELLRSRRRSPHPRREP